MTNLHDIRYYNPSVVVVGDKKIDVERRKGVVLSV
jgi:hypothetical protein